MKNVFLLPSKTPSVLGRVYEADKMCLHIYSRYQPGRRSAVVSPCFINDLFDNLAHDHNIYITCAEAIKEGDWCIHPLDKSPTQYFKLKYQPTRDNIREYGYSKIVMTTDVTLLQYGIQEIPMEFIQYYVKKANDSGVPIDIVDVSILRVPIDTASVVVFKPGIEGFPFPKFIQFRNHYTLFPILYGERKITMETARGLIQKGTHKLLLDEDMHDERFHHIFTEKNRRTSYTSQGSYFWKLRGSQPGATIKLSNIIKPVVKEFKKGDKVLYSFTDASEKQQFTLEQNLGKMSDIKDKEGHLHRVWNYLLEEAPSWYPTAININPWPGILANFDEVFKPQKLQLQRLYTEEKMIELMETYTKYYFKQGSKRKPFRDWLKMYNNILEKEL